MNIKYKFIILLILFQWFINPLFKIDKANAIIPYYTLLNTKNLKKDSIEIGKSAYQLLYFGQKKESLRLAKLAISLNSSDEKLWAILAECQIANKYFDRALYSLRKGIKINPNMSELYFAESSIFFNQNKIKKAKKSLVTGLKIDPENTSAIFQLGNIFLIEKKYNKAIIQFKKALKVKPDFWQAINNIGLAYFELNKQIQAISSFKEALSIEENAEPLLGLAISIHDKDSETSLKLIKKSLKKDPNYVSEKFRKDQLWGNKIQEKTLEIFKLKALQNTINYANQLIK